MGSNARVPSSDSSSEDTGGNDVALGDLLSGRLADVDVNSVEAVREFRERK